MKITKMRFSNPLAKLVALCLMTWTISAQAILMPPVTVNDTEWLQPTDFLGVGWHTLAAVCDPGSGACSGLINGDDVTGWIWASRDEIYPLFNVFLPPGARLHGPGYSGSGHDPVAVANFEAAGFQFAANPDLQGFKVFEVFGFTRESLGNGSAIAAVAGRSNVVDPFLSRVSTADDYRYAGAWLYRSQVPTAATLPLLILGLGALGVKRRQSQRS